jgi:histidine triad (HIT) family protein
MSAASSTAKGWLLPVVTATYGYAITQNDGSIALLGIAALGLFAILDANYLRQEQAYRRLYDTVASKRRPVPSFTLDPSEADDPPQADAPPAKKVRVLVGRWLPAARVWLSWSIAPFYGGLLLVGLLIALTA